MATSNIELVQQLYVAYYNRPADVAGLNFWVAALDSGATVAQISKDFNTAPEYTALFAGKNAEAVVNTVYMNLFGRPADATGLDFWGPKVATGAITTAGLVTEFLKGAVNPDGTPNADAIAFANKVTVAGAFTTQIATPGNEAQRLAYNSATPTTLANIKAFIAGVTDAASTTAALANVKAVAEAAVISNTPTVNTTLTTGVDTIVGGAGNDVINGSDTTFTGLDTIDGGAGVNTLNVSSVAAGINLALATVSNIKTANIQSTGNLAGNAGDVSGWTGLTAANFTLKSANTQTITAADTTAVTVSNTTGATVIGGSSINVTTGSAAAALALNTAATGAAGTTLSTALAAAATVAAAQAATAAAVTAGALTAAQKTTIDAAYTTGFATDAATGQAAAAAAFTTILAADAAALAALNVTATDNNALASAVVKGGNVIAITDGSDAGTVLKSVSLNGNIGTATLTGNGLVGVALANTSASTQIINTVAHAQAVSVDNVKGGTITDAGATGVTITAAGTKSSGVSLSAAAATKVTLASAVDLTVADIAANVATSIAVTGAGKTTISGLSAAAALVSIDATASTGGVTVTPTLAAGVAFAGGAGKDAITLGASTKAITTGAGDDTVTVTAALGTGGAVEAGAGVDALAGTAAAIAAVIPGAAKFTGFETLKISDALANTASFDVSGFAGVVNFIAANGVATGATATAAGLGANANVTLTGDLVTNHGILTLASKTDTATDVINVTLAHNYLDNNDTVADPVAVGVAITASTVETLNVTSTAVNTLTADTIAGYKADVVTNTLTLVDDAIVTLKVSGDAAFAFSSTLGETKLATIDASANTGGVNINASAAVAGSAALSIKGSATAANTLTGGATVDTIVGGSKADTIKGGANGDTLTGGAGNDKFVFTAGDSQIGTGKFDTITDFSANTFGLGTNGAAGIGANLSDATKVTGDVLSFVARGDGTGGVIVDTLGSAADASTYLANHANTANTVVAALDSANNNLYVDNTGDGVADFYIHLTGVTTITAAAFTVV